MCDCRRFFILGILEGCFVADVGTRKSGMVVVDVSQF